MKANISVEIRPFTVPNFVLFKDIGVEVDISLPISPLDAEVLDRLCSEFRIAVFKKANVEQPPSAYPICLKCERAL